LSADAARVNAVANEAKLRQWWVRVVSRPRIIALRRRFAPQVAFVQARLSRESELGLPLTLGVLLLIGATWLFGGVAEDIVAGDPLIEVDAQITHWLHAHATPGVTRYMLLITHVHGTTGASLLAVALAFFLLWKKEWYWLLALVIALPGGMLINVLLKQVFLRERPSFSDPILTLASYSFPSGHVAGATLFYGVLAAFLVSNLRTWRLRAIIVLAACVLVIVVGISRIYLGVHYFSDVVAAAAVSTAWLALCLIAVNALRRRRRKTRRDVDT